MSRRRRVDYQSVLEAVVDAMPRRPRVQAVVADFELAVWTAVRHVLSGVVMRGCNFHFAQALWRNVQSLGLQSLYSSDDAVNRVCRKTMALSYLPSAAIPAAFEELERDNVRPVVTAHLDYVRRNWVESAVWPPSSWSVFMQPIRTNNDVEGWHRRLNSKAGHGKLNLYQLVSLLQQEATLGDVEVKLMSQGAAVRVQRSKYRKMNDFIFARWAEYSQGTRSAASLLSACSHAVKHV